jgi:predicted DNA binding CopG/RHH family protein
MKEEYKNEKQIMLTVRVPQSLHKSLKVNAVSTGQAIQDIIASLIHAYLLEQGALDK